MVRMWDLSLLMSNFQSSSTSSMLCVGLRIRSPNDHVRWLATFATSRAFLRHPQTTFNGARRSVASEMRTPTSRKVIAASRARPLFEGLSISWETAEGDGRSTGAAGQTSRSSFAGCFPFLFFVFFDERNQDMSPVGR